MTAVQTRPNGRIVSVVPKDEAETMNEVHGEDIDDQPVTWHVESRERLRVQRATYRDIQKVPTTKVRFDEASGSYTVTIPAAIAHAMHIVGGELEWDVKAGKLYASIESRGGDNE